VIARVEDIFVTAGGGAPMRRIAAAQAGTGAGLDGDRYGLSRGHWSGHDTCHVTLIEAEALDAAARDYAVAVADGEHRRNIVTRGVRLDALIGRRFLIGEALVAYDKPRPPCGYLAGLTEPLMTKALWQRAGICVSVLRGGTVRVGDAIVLVEVTGAPAGEAGAASAG